MPYPMATGMRSGVHERVAAYPTGDTYYESLMARFWWPMLAALIRRFTPPVHGYLPIRRFRCRTRARHARPALADRGPGSRLVCARDAANRHGSREGAMDFVDRRL